ncbi:predicted protein [Nematostella vectensis]|uniref:5'-nucleotidase n=1 Tax=Nematostella vectensis TaxID=45351 RepID=A7S7S9_NEMVE|nr:predicted protein [Nematostella vectensis]|eukprot:XP_001632308.1 predicted protein [Nematostella vectensis]
MFAVAAVGASALAGYGVYMYLKGRKRREIIKKAVDEMMHGLDKPSVYISDSVGVREKLQRIYEAGIDKIQILTDFDKTLTKFIVDGTPGNTIQEALEKSGHIPESFRAKFADLKDHYLPILSGDMSSNEKESVILEWCSKVNDLIVELNLKKDDLPAIVRDGLLVLREGVEWLFVKTSENKVPVFILSEGLGDLIEEVIRQQSQLYDNVTIMANYMKFNQGVMVGIHGKLLTSGNKQEQAKNNLFFEKNKDRSSAIVMGDSIRDSEMASSLRNAENVITVGILNEKVDENLKAYQEAFDVVIVDDHSISVVDVVLMSLLREK